MLKRDIRFFLKLFWSTFTLSAFTFGGGYVIVPLMRKRFVEQYHWIDENEILDMIAIAQSSPGPLAVNASIILGYRMAGIKGSLVTMLGTILPPLVIITVISFFYAAFKESVIAQRVLLGMQAGVAAVIASVVATMAAGIIKQKRWLPIAVMTGVFVLSAVLKINVVYIILACASVGLVDTLIRLRRSRAEEDER